MVATILYPFAFHLLCVSGNGPGTVQRLLCSVGMTSVDEDERPKSLLTREPRKYRGSGPEVRGT